MSLAYHPQTFPFFSKTSSNTQLLAPKTSRQRANTWIGFNDSQVAHREKRIHVQGSSKYEHRKIYFDAKKRI